MCFLLCKRCVHHVGDWGTLFACSCSQQEKKSVTVSQSRVTTEAGKSRVAARRLCGGRNAAAQIRERGDWISQNGVPGHCCDVEVTGKGKQV